MFSEHFSCQLWKELVFWTVSQSWLVLVRLCLPCGCLGWEATKTERKNSRLLLGVFLTIGISYPFICFELLVRAGKMEMKKQTLWNKYICIARQSSQRRWLIIEFSIHCICVHNTKLPFSFHVPFDPQQILSWWNVWDFAYSARADHVFCDW